MNSVPNRQICVLQGRQKQHDHLLSVCLNCVRFVLFRFFLALPLVKACRAMFGRLSGRPSSTLKYDLPSHVLTVRRRRRVVHGLDDDECNYILVLRDHNTETEWIDDQPLPEDRLEISVDETQIMEATLYRCKPFQNGGDGGLKVVDATSMICAYSSAAVEQKPDQTTTSLPRKGDLTVSVRRSTYHRASVHWSQPGDESDKWKISLTRLEFNGQPPAVSFFDVGACRQRSFDLPLELTAGAEYRVCVKAMKQPSEDGLFVVRHDGAVVFTAGELRIINDVT